MRHLDVPRILACCVVLAVSGVGSAKAQSWPTHDFQLVAVDQTTITVPILAYHAEVHESLASLGLDPTTIGSFDLPDSTRIAIEDVLNQTAEILDVWGFSAPNLYRPASALGDYRVFIVDDLVVDSSGAWGSYGHRYSFCRGSRIIFLSAADILVGGALSLRGRQTVAHELFHAVQGGSPFFQASNAVDRVLDCTEWPGDWLTEGTARAIGWDVVRLIHSTNIPLPNRLEAWGRRSYSEVLAIPSKEGSVADPYHTSSFWRYVGEATGSGFWPGPGKDERIDYRYLAALFNSPPVGGGCFAAGTPCTAEARWLDSRLRGLMGASLRDVYARFVGTYALYGGHRAAGSAAPLNAESWRDDSFDEGCRGVMLSEALKTIEQTSRVSLMHQMSTQCWALTLTGFDRDVNVLAIVEGSEGPWNFSDLSAITSHDEEDTALPQVADPKRAQPLTNPETGQPFAEFVFGFPEGTSWFFLTNMADDPSTTRPMNNLRVRFLPLEGWAYMGSSEGGGPAAAEIDAPLPIELDEIRRAVVSENDSPAHQRLGHRDVCSLNLSFTNSGSFDALGIRLDHEGPIAPGDYPIFNDGEYGVSLDFVEENPGVALVTFGVDLGLSAEDQDDISYLGRAGTLTLEYVSPHLVKGRVDVSGDRICIASPDQRECPGPPAVRAEAVFSVLPTWVISSRPPSPGCFVTNPTPESTLAGGQDPAPPGGQPPSESPAPPPPPPGGDSPAPGSPPPGGSAPVTGSGVPTGSGDAGGSSGAGEPAAEAGSSADGDTGTVDGFVNRFSLEAGGRADTSLLLRADDVVITGGCTGTTPISIGFHRGQPQSPDWVSVAFETAAPVGTGETGEFELAELRWDDGTVVPGNLPPNSGVRVPNRFTGAGSLTLTRHDATVGGQRMIGTLTSGSLTNRDGTSASLTVEFDIDRSCGVTPG